MGSEYLLTNYFVKNYSFPVIADSPQTCWHSARKPRILEASLGRREASMIAIAFYCLSATALAGAGPMPRAGAGIDKPESARESLYRAEARFVEETA
jgi:hypothetical protein